MIWLLHAILFLLKWIGIVLLGLIALVLLILLAVLIIPIRYQVEGSYYQDVTAKVKVNWFFSAIAIYFQLQGKKSDFHVKLFGISLIGDRSKSNKKKSRKQSKNTEQKQDTVTSSPKDEVVAEPNTPTDFSAISIEEISSSEKEKDFPEQEIKHTDSKEDSKPKKEKTQKKKMDFEGFKKKIAFLKEQWEDSGNRALLKEILFRLKKLFLHLLPTKVYLKLHFGLENPASMGQILSILAFLYPIYGESIQILPDFEEKVIEGEGLAKGRIRLMVFVYAAIRILLNPQVRILIRRMKRQNGVRS